MKSSSVFRSRYLLAVLAGLLLTCAFPEVDLAGMAWVAPGLMVAAALGNNGWARFRIGYLAALTHYLSMLYWLLLIPYRWHGIPFGPATGWLALSGFAALFPATWVWFVSESQTRTAKNHPHDSGPGRSLAGQCGDSTEPDAREGKGVLARTWLRRTLWTLLGAAVWVASEMILARIFGGFPWDLLGVSQYRMVPLIQVSSITGVYGVSFLVIWVSLALFSAGLMVIRRPGARSVWVGELFLPLLVAALLFNLGFRQLHREPPTNHRLKVTMVQPSIPQTLIWNSANDALRFEELLRLTETALTNQTDLLIWPESAVPRMVRYDTNTFAAISGLARRHHIWMIIGSDDAEARPNGKTLEDADFFNSSFLVSPDGELAQRYIKRNLVIFGEYLPLQNWLPFLKVFTPIEGGFTPGKHAVPFVMPQLHVQTSVLICFEDVFPHLARCDVNAQTDFLVNITNDGWFGNSAEQWQHGASGLFRAIENGLPLLRCCNNGLTCWIDCHGRLAQVFRDEQGTIYGKGYLTVEVPLPAAGTGHAMTFYIRYGDWFGWGCVGVTAVILMARLAKGRLASRRGRKGEKEVL